MLQELNSNMSEKIQQDQAEGLALQEAKPKLKRPPLYKDSTTVNSRAPTYG